MSPLFPMNIFASSSRTRAKDFSVVSACIWTGRFPHDNGHVGHKTLAPKFHVDTDQVQLFIVTSRNPQTHQTHNGYGHWREKEGRAVTVGSHAPRLYMCINNASTGSINTLTTTNRVTRCCIPLVQLCTCTCTVPVQYL